MGNLILATGTTPVYFHYTVRTAKDTFLWFVVILPTIRQPARSYKENSAISEEPVVAVGIYALHFLPRRVYDHFKLSVPLVLHPGSTQLSTSVDDAVPGLVIGVIYVGVGRNVLLSVVTCCDLMHALVSHFASQEVGTR